MINWDNYKIDNFEQTLNSASKPGKLLSFRPKDIDIGVTKIKSPNPIGLDGLPIIPAKSHVQGVASYEDYLIMTHNSKSEEADYV